MNEKNRGDIMEPATEKLMDEQVYPETEAINQKLAWFEDQKLGVIFHWGLYAQAGIVESWQLSEADVWAREPVPWRDDVKELQKDYWNLIEDFNPRSFDANVWAKQCRAAGFKYMIFTTKHHDGFHLYDTQASDYKIGGSRSPFKRDIFKEVVAAFRQEGLGIGAYYSKADWYCPYYWIDNDAVKSRRANYDPTVDVERWEKYVDYVHDELQEITQNYGKLDILWLDAGWCGQGKEDLRMDELAEKLRKTTPDLLIVDRMMGGRHENYVTPERKIPTVAEIPAKTWESNIPLARNWGYVPGDRYKSSQEIILNVIDVVTKGGNLLLGVGPTAEGTFTVESQQILKDLGQWMADNGAGIYGTRPLKSLTAQRQWQMTQKENVYYGFYVLDKKEPKTLFLEKEQVEAKEIKQISTLDKKEQIEFDVQDQGYVLTLPKRHFPWQIVSIKIEV